MGQNWETLSQTSLKLCVLKDFLTPLDMATINALFNERKELSFTLYPCIDIAGIR